MPGRRACANWSNGAICGRDEACASGAACGCTGSCSRAEARPAQRWRGRVRAPQSAGGIWSPSLGSCTPAQQPGLGQLREGRRLLVARQIHHTGSCTSVKGHPVANCGTNACGRHTCGRITGALAMVWLGLNVPADDGARFGELARFAGPGLGGRRTRPVG
eukprot:scaffold6907_cov132-Isochrysis_galbana.AAC.1